MIKTNAKLGNRNRLITSDTSLKVLVFLVYTFEFSTSTEFFTDFWKSTFNRSSLSDIGLEQDDDQGGLWILKLRRWNVECWYLKTR
jgi:hypothetical protein